jgi:hypothetical protein
MGKTRRYLSLSLKIRDLIKEALEIEEDRALVHIAEKTRTIVRPEEGLDPSAGMVTRVSAEALSALHIAVPTRQNIYSTFQLDNL